MVVFWLIIIVLVVALGFGIAALGGDKLYDGTKKIAKTYFDEEKGNEEDE